MDIFGIHTAPDPAAQPGAGPIGSRAGYRKAWWAMFLALDTAAICVLGGATSVLWMNRPKALVTAQPGNRPHRAMPKQAAPATPAAAKPEEPAKPAETKAPAPAPKETKEPPKESKLPIGSPQVAGVEVPRRQAQATGTGATPTSAAKPEAASAQAKPSSGRPKAVATEFACQAPASAQKVLLKGPFLVRTGGTKPMVKESDGTWKLTISLLPGAYKYSCVVDGKRSKPFEIDVQ